MAKKKNTEETKEALDETEEVVEELTEAKENEETETVGHEETAEVPETVEEEIVEETEPVEEAAPEEEKKEEETTEQIDVLEDLVACRFCGKQIPKIAKHCPYCGKALVETEQKKNIFANKKLLALAAAALVVVGILVFVLPGMGKNNTYNSAIDSMREGNYDEAIEAFRSLEGYKESDEYIVYCDALKSAQNGDLDKAISRFSSVSGLEDADSYVSYLTATQDLQYGYFEENYEAAREAFEEAGDFLDSKAMADYCQGIISFLNDEPSAAEKLQNILDEQAVNGMYLETAYSAIRFLDARQKFDNDDRSSLDEFRKLLDEGNELIASKAGEYADYIQGLEYYEQELFYSAYNCFSRCRGLKDASELADSCFQERPSSGILYKNTSSSVSVTIYDTADGDDMYVKIYDSADNLIETLYIRDGASVTAKFQSGSSRMAVAWGEPEDWFGPNEAYGSMGSYQRLLLDGSNEYFSFPSGGAYTLHFNSANGNVGSEYSTYGDF